MTTPKPKIKDILNRLYDNAIPAYLKHVYQDKITVIVQGNGNDDETEEIDVTPKDLQVFFKEETQNKSGLRTLAGYSGDWRLMTNLALELFEIYKAIGTVVIVVYSASKEWNP